MIDLAGVVRQIGLRMINGQQCTQWALGNTREISRDMHVLPLTVKLSPGKPSDPG